MSKEIEFDSLEFDASANISYHNRGKLRVSLYESPITSQGWRSGLLLNPVSQFLTIISSLNILYLITTLLLKKKLASSSLTLSN